MGDLLEQLELGECREIIASGLLDAVKEVSGWKDCFVVSEDKEKFYMFEEGTNALLLTAKKSGNHFFISQYEDYPEHRGTNGYCCLLRRNQTGFGYTLVSCSCELCDENLQKFSCISGESSYEPSDRQILAKISQRKKTIEGIEIETRCLSVRIPASHPRDHSRIVWCPRTMGLNKTSEEILSINEKLRSRDLSEVVEETKLDDDDEEREQLHLSRKKRKNQVIIAKDSVDLETKLPEWNDDVGSLVLSFRKKRVTCASSKNFILIQEDGKQILQFGKVRPNRFNLDFRSPMSPLQAFGIALSAYGFTLQN